MNELTARERISRARITLLREEPFWSVLAMRLSVREDPGCPTMGTDGKSLVFNAAFVKELSNAELNGALVHEICHVMFKHHLRRGERDPWKWNCAIDYAVNLIVRDSGYHLPEGVLIDEKYRGMTAEEIYDKLPILSKGSGNGQNGEPNGGEGDQDGDGNSPGPNYQGWREGTGPLDWVSDAQSQANPGQKATETEAKQMAREVDRAVVQAAQVAKKRGKLPGIAEEFLSALKEPKVEWREKLRRWATEITRNDYTFDRPNRRFTPLGVFLPNLKSPEIGKGTVMVDTSGSVSQKEFVEFMSEVFGILELYTEEPELQFIQIDTAVREVRTISELDLADLRLLGRGGTDFRPGFDYLREEGEEPNFVVYFTDGYCDSFPEAPPFPVMWVISRGGLSLKPPFGEVIELDKTE